MSVDFHEWLLSDSVDLLPRLLLPLAGPEEFDDDDIEKLPDDLQYLPPDKTRETDPDVRIMLLEAVYQVGMKSSLNFRDRLGLNDCDSDRRKCWLH